MKALSSKEIYGNWATLLLPLNADDSIDYPALEAEIELLIAQKVNGIYSNGTAGEFYSLSEAEFDRVSQLLAEKCNAAAMPFQIGCSQMSAQLALQRLRRAVGLQPSAIQVILPDWFPPGMPEIVDFLARMAQEAAPVGLVLYNPPHAKKQLKPEDFAHIRAAGIKLVGCKLAGGDEEWYTAMRKQELSLFVPGHHLATGFSRGAAGAYSNVACLHPGAAQQWYETMTSDPEAALETEKRIQSFMNGSMVPYLRKGYSNQAVDKLMAAAGGWGPLDSRLRWPYRSIPEDEIPAVRAAGRKLIPEFFENTCG